MEKLTREEWLNQAAEFMIVERMAPHWEIRADLEYKISVFISPKSVIITQSNLVGVSEIIFISFTKS